MPAGLGGAMRRKAKASSRVQAHALANVELSCTQLPRAARFANIARNRGSSKALHKPSYISFRILSIEKMCLFGLCRYHRTETAGKGHDGGMKLRNLTDLGDPTSLSTDANHVRGPPQISRENLPTVRKKPGAYVDLGPANRLP